MINSLSSKLSRAGPVCDKVSILRCKVVRYSKRAFRTMLYYKTPSNRLGIAKVEIENKSREIIKICFSVAAYHPLRNANFLDASSGEGMKIGIYDYEQALMELNNARGLHCFIPRTAL